MKIIITGICGFAGSEIAIRLLETFTNLKIIGLDNFSRKGSELNLPRLQCLGVEVRRGDLKNAKNIDELPRVDWVIDCAANPSVVAGLNDSGGSKALMDNNLGGTIHVLEYCRRYNTGLILLSTSRVYSIQALQKVALVLEENAFHPAPTPTLLGLSHRGISEAFSTTPPLSLYGASKYASEILSLEYASSFNFPLWINRCGVLAGARQFGKADQGIFSFWIHSWVARRPLHYTGFGGMGFQVRDALHPKDVATLIIHQMQSPHLHIDRIMNVAGGASHAISLAELSQWCSARFGTHEVVQDSNTHPFDVPWLVLDTTRAQVNWNWQPTYSLQSILEEIAEHALDQPNWLEEVC